ncbi:MAG: iron-containing alcohol dehydrogenase [Spirochaetia bacterium]|jgi:alcohol dehydrogenase YqhD (iron-dependent ADH family)|nr:iron-containing alcohol dehydrogenase [Spirochaetia bacterium]
MKDFIYYAPTKVIFGKDVELQAGAQLKAFGAKIVLVHYGSERIVKNGLMDRVLESIRKEGIKTVVFGGVTANPKLSLVTEATEFARKHNVDFILAIGGGSVIDSAKAIGYSLADNEKGNVWDFYAKTRTPKGCIPIGTVLTIAAAGSEMSDSSVITNDHLHLKRGYSSQYARCRFALENPALTVTVPPYQSASGAFDIVMHTLERYFFNGPRTSLTDELAEGLIRSVFKAIRQVLDNPKDLDARGNLMWASSLAHNDLMQCGNGTRGDWACHQFSHELSGMFDSAHGASIAAVWTHWASYVYKENPKAFAQLGNRTFSIAPSGDIEEDARNTIKEMKHVIESIGLPTDLHHLLGKTPTDEEIELLSERCSFNGTRTIGNIKKLDKEDIRSIYRSAR